MEVCNSNEICSKYCPRKFENLTNTEKCPFTLIEWSIESEKEETKLNTHCSKMGTSLEEIIIKRIIDITKGTVKIIKESIGKRNIHIVDSPKWPRETDNTKPMYPGVNYPQFPNGGNINVPFSPNITTTSGTNSISHSMNTSGGTKSDI